MFSYILLEIFEKQANQKGFTFFIIQGVLKMAHNIYVTRIYVDYQTKKFYFEFGLR
jgi:hypothetical protein